MSITASEARKRLFPLIEQVNDDQEAIEIVSKRGTAFLVPADEYRSLRETEYLLHGRNGDILRDSVASARNGEYRMHDLLDPATAIPVKA